MAVNSTTSPVYSKPDGTCTGGITEQFVMQPLNGSTTATSIAPGSQTIVKSEATGKYCRVTTLSDGTQGMLCDVSDPAQATPLTYTGSGLTYNGQPLASTSPGSALVVSPGASTEDSSMTINTAGGRPMQLPAHWLHAPCQAACMLIPALLQASGWGKCWHGLAGTAFITAAVRPFACAAT